MTSPRFYLLLSAFLICSLCSRAQDAAIGYWESHLPYNSAVGVATDGATIFTICNQAFFTYNITGDDAPVPYSKVEGMSDIAMQSIGYDPSTRTVILAYSNGNIDLFKDNTFYNIPDFKLQVLFENKRIFRIYAENGKAYLCTSVGIIVIDLLKHVILNTYPLYLNNEVTPINGMTALGDYFYVVPRKGLYRTEKNNHQITDLQTWQCIDSTDTLANVVIVNQQLFVSSKKKIYSLTADTLQQVYASAKNIQHISAGYNKLMIGVSNAPTGSIKVMDLNHALIDSFDCPDSTVQAVQMADSSLWVAVPNGGLVKRTGGNTTEFRTPDGPSSQFSFDIYANNRDLYIAHGGYATNLFANSSYNGFSNYSNGKWRLYKRGTFPVLDNTRDISTILKDESTGTLYAGSYLDGLFVRNNDSSAEMVNQNALFDGSIAYGSSAHQVIGMALDQSGSLWVSMMFSRHQLYAKDKNGSWYKFTTPNAFYGGQISIDDNGQVWVVGSSGNGVMVFNYNKTLADTADDAAYRLGAGSGFGNLPSNTVYCIAKDKKNQMWVGTDNGVAIFRNCTARPNTDVCEAEIPVDNICSLFVGKIVTSIAIDELDRKWIGTHEGVWLISADAQRLICHFDAENSPVPSNVVQKISIDKVTGDVYIGTDQGLVSYHGTVTEGTNSGDSIIAFPNPVPPEYGGTIAIRGIPTDADVRITDINGQLVYHTKALGGQALWDGKDYTGRRPETGVYLFFVSSADARQVYKGKIVFIR